MRYAATKHIFSYWRRLKGSRPAPQRADINPADIGRYLGDLMLLERKQGHSFQFRIAGSRLCSLYDGELRGRDLTMILLPQADDDAMDMLSAVVEDVLPVIAGVSLVLTDGSSLEGELLLMPLFHEGRTDSRVLGAITFRPQDRMVKGFCAGLDILTFRVLHEADDMQSLHPLEPELPFGAGVMERRGHLTVLRGGLHQA